MTLKINNTRVVLLKNKIEIITPKELTREQTNAIGRYLMDEGFMPEAGFYIETFLEVT